ncbi:MAG: hypothetical protein ACRC0X_07365 [Brevinema sp.]
MSAKQATLNIYLEQCIPNASPQDIWYHVIHSKEFQSFFVEETFDFQQKNNGALLWRKFMFFNVLGHYEVESYQENKHLLLKILSNNFSSLLLITIEETRDGILLRIDHRSFYGEHKNHFRQLFTKRWEKMLKNLDFKK